MPTNLNPKSETNAIILAKTGSKNDVAESIPFQIYTGSADFLEGAFLEELLVGVVLFFLTLFEEFFFELFEFFVWVFFSIFILKR